MKLREVTVPHFEARDNFDTNRFSSLPAEFSKSGLKRPVDPVTGRSLVGLYQWPSSTSNQGVIFRPLPAAKADMSLPGPSLIFQIPCLEDAQEIIQNSGAQIAKLGYSGGGKKTGQLLVKHQDLSGLDVRFCESDRISTFFDEGQNALLAASLDELQSPNVMSEGSGLVGPNAKTTHSDEKLQSSDSSNNMGDCWIEFRASMKRPMGFAKTWKAATGNTPPRTAKVPNIPYE